MKPDTRNRNKGVKASEVRKLIGQQVEWDVDSLAFPKRRGIIKEVKGRNVRINDDWLWLPEIKEFRIVQEKM